MNEPTETIAPAKGKERQVFAEHLHSRELKMTRERQQILSEVFRTAGHFRPDDLLVRFRTNNVRISRATIYRTLDLLVSAGLVRRTAFPGTSAFYERAHKVQGHNHHDHLYCTSCGSIFEFHNEEIERLQEKVCDKFGFEIHGHSHQITGRCGQCRRKAGGEE